MRETSEKPQEVHHEKAVAELQLQRPKLCTDHPGCSLSDSMHGLTCAAVYAEMPSRLLRSWHLLKKA